MPIAALEGLDPKTAAAVLVEAALQVGPHISHDRPSVWQTQVDEVLDELRTRLNLSATDVDARAHQRLDDALADEIDRVAFSDIELSKARRSLGSTGELSAGGYRVRFQGNFLATFKEDEKFIRRCIDSAEFTQHVNPAFEWEDRFDDYRISLFMKKAKAKSGEHWVIVQANRINDELHVIAAWRAFPRVLNLESLVQPLDVLRSFALHYGEIIKAPGHPAKAFLENIDLGAWNRDRFSENNRVAEPVINRFKPQTYYVETGYRTPAGRAILACAYSIDAELYRPDLRKYAY
ncbi:hypothetical protein [Sphingomonas sp. OK281]|uniref:hypothetical protein n=1 Tax=Sphingomonas sp. OK281 TaxID=1881067 RepID=UPI0008ED8B67|nr:hypothetical protein [Sphingomonas sp. OK281]SFO18785.1 hypothetical protein SAMN05428984_2613 [Sphingomonas sp. OK281]